MHPVTPAAEERRKGALRARAAHLAKDTQRVWRDALAREADATRERPREGIAGARDNPIDSTI
eukprot:2691224-Pyramimonas_sp.AAC.1